MKDDAVKLDVVKVDAVNVDRSRKIVGETIYGVVFLGEGSADLCT